MWSSWTEKAKKQFNDAIEKTGDALEKTGDVLTKAATVHAPIVPAKPRSSTDAAGDTTTTDIATSSSNSESTKYAGRYSNEENKNQNQQQVLAMNLQKGWTSMIQSTKQSLQKAQEVVEREQFRIQTEMSKRLAQSKRRDPKLPLDVQALKDAQVVYITDRIITMSHPALASNTNPEITSDRKLAAVGHMLQRRHNGQYMVWNLSEMEYETTLLNDQVLTFSFPGSPAPSLGLWLKLLISMESWMNADENNIAVVHCLTGKGRTSTVLASFLCWMGQAKFKKIHQALDYIAMCKHLSVDELTIPSQRRYASYFENMFDGIRPNQSPLIIKRILMSQAPRFAKGPLRGDEHDNNKEALMGCAPYLQIFKAGKLIYTTAASLSYRDKKEPSSETTKNTDGGESEENTEKSSKNKNKTNTQELPFCQVADGQITFHLEDQIIQGDILIRCRHWNPRTKSRLSIFRAAFHTGYCPSKVFRLTKSQLDGACSDKRFADDFYLDILLEPCDPKRASEHLQKTQEEEEKQKKKEENDGKDIKNKEKSRTQVVVTASTDDAMLHRESRFWDVITQRRQKAQNEDSDNKDAKETPTDSKDNDPMWGKTIGRRRQFPKLNDGNENDKDSDMANPKAALETFSIGGELDFLPESYDEQPAQVQPQAPKKKQPDSLMEALMALDQDEDAHVEEIVFDDQADEGKNTSKNEAASGEAGKQVDTTNKAAGSDTKNDTTENASAEQNEQADSKKNASAATDAAGNISADGANPSTSDQAKYGKQESTTESMKDMEELLHTELDQNMDDLLAVDMSDIDAGVSFDGLDFDDAELEDLENFLTK